MNQCATLCLIIFIFSFHGHSEAKTVHLDHQTQRIDISHAVQFIEDQNNHLTFEDILNLAPSSFNQVSNKNINQGISNSAYWLKLELQSNHDKAPTRWIIEHPNPTLDQITAFIPNQNRHYEVITSGDHLNFHGRPNTFSNPTFTFQLAPGETKTIYIRVAGHAIKNFIFHLRSEREFQIYSSKFYSGHGVFFGLLILMAIANLLLYFPTKNFTYIFYAAHIISYGLFLATQLGLSSQFLWPANTWLNTQALAISASSSMFFMCVLASSFLEIVNYSRFINNIIKLEALVVLLSAVGLLTFKTTQLVNVVVWSFFIIIISNFIFAVIAYFKGNKSARFFILAWCAFTFTFALGAMTAAGKLQLYIPTTYLQQVGIILEMLLFSVALFDRVNQLRQANIIAEMKNKALLKESNSHLEQANLLKDQFLATISHELRTPLNGIEGALKLIRSQQLSATVKEYLELASRSSNAIVKMIDDILLLTEIQSGQNKSMAVKMDLAKFLNRLCAFYKPVANNKGIKLEKHIGKSLPDYVIAEEKFLERILAPLIDNAIKFTHHGTVSFSCFANKEDDCRDRITFKIEDTGKSIPEENATDLFQPFKQADGSHSRKYGGLGLGLSMAQQLVDSLGGNIYYSNNNGQGNTFTVELCLHHIDSLDTQVPANESEFDQASHPHIDNAEQYTILVVEDNATNQLILVKILEKLGYQCISAENGKLALEALANNNIDLILMDCQMPVLDGYETTIAIRKNHRLSHIPIIAVTANAMTADRERCFQVGMDDYVKKPINNEKLAAKIATWLGKKHQGEKHAI